MDSLINISSSSTSSDEEVYSYTSHLIKDENLDDQKLSITPHRKVYVMPKEEQKKMDFCNIVRNHRKNINRSQESQVIINTEIKSPKNIRERVEAVRRSLPVKERLGSPRKRCHSVELYKPPLSSSLLTPIKMLSECDINACTPNKRFKTSTAHQPMYMNHQLLGDSQLLRFSEQCLNLRHCLTTTPDTKQRCLGYCVSGQKIEDLQRRLSLNDYQVDKKVILLIGTNDFLYNTPLNLMYETFTTLLKQLQKRTKSIVILTVPPIPKYNNNDHYMKKLLSYNNFLSKHHNGDEIHVIDIASHYIGFNNSAMKQYFEETYGNTTRIDQIHLNYKGFQLLQFLLKLEYFDKMCN